MSKNRSLATVAIPTDDNDNRQFNMPATQTALETCEASEVVSLADSLTNSPPSHVNPPESTNSNGKNMKGSALFENMNAFDDEASRGLFDVIDQLHSCGVEREVDIPQLVIVGGQSTGKSSLLQSLTNIPFPIGAGCCTRFPTRIVSRRAPPGSEDIVTIRIETADVDEDYFDYPEDFKYRDYSYTTSRLSVTEFELIIMEVSSEYMGIRCGKRPGKKNFATEVLRIEMSGPSQSHFSILDLPGVFSNPFSVNDAEMDGIKKTVADYMEDSNNIVIVVADATTDLANQEIFKMANDLVEKERFVGVFTKCDLVQDAAEIARLASELGESNAMSKHDRWFVSRSRSQRDYADFDLQRAETMLFDKPPWNKLRDDRRGSMMLKTYLGSLLCAKMRDDFSWIRYHIQELLRIAKGSRKVLGDARSSHHLRQLYLRDAVERYHVIAKKALDSPGNLSDTEMMVRSQVRDSSDWFTKAMREIGHAYEFEDAGTDPAKTLADTISLYYDCDSVATGHSTASKKTDQQKLKDKKQMSLVTKIKSELEVWQTTELPGLLNTEVVKVLFKEQTKNWERLAESHIDDVYNRVQRACDLILKQVFKSDRGSKTLRSELAAVLEQFRLRAKKKACQELKEYYRRERELHLQTTDARFGQNLEALRSARLLETLKSMPKQSGDLADPMNHAGALLRHFHYSAEDNMVQEVHDIVKVYYQLSIDAFVRHVNNHIIENFISDVNGPLLGLSTDWVLQLKPEEVDKFGREDANVVRKRARLDEKIGRLLAATKIVEDFRSLNPSLEATGD